MSVKRTLSALSWGNAEGAHTAVKCERLMGLVGSFVARAYLNAKVWPQNDNQLPEAYRERSKLEVLFGQDVWDEFRGKAVLDFGCGEGREAVEIALHGAARVVGIDIREDLLRKASARAVDASVDSICEFARSADGKFDIVLSLDSMEHFPEPSRELAEMADLLGPAGYVLMSFGPPWFHPLGHHFPLFPWAHLVFTERSMMDWRARFKNDGARRFNECLGGLNQMTIGKFERLVKQSGLQFATYECVPIRQLHPLHNRLTREFTTAIIRSRLRAPFAQPRPRSMAARSGNS
jgi:SAM-dependent methyltransferase